MIALRYKEDMNGNSCGPMAEQQIETGKYIEHETTPIRKQFGVEEREAETDCPKNLSSFVYNNYQTLKINQATKSSELEPEAEDDCEMTETNNFREKQNQKASGQPCINLYRKQPPPVPESDSHANIAPPGRTPDFYCLLDARFAPNCETSAGIIREVKLDLDQESTLDYRARRRRRRRCGRLDETISSRADESQISHAPSQLQTTIDDQTPSLNRKFKYSRRIMGTRLDAPAGKGPASINWTKSSKSNSVFSHKWSLLTISIALLFIHSNLDKPNTCSCSGLKLTVSMPDLVRVNDAFWLNCSQNAVNSNELISNNNNNNNYDQLERRKSLQQLATASDQQQIYAIKWFKDDVLFYRFLPNSSSQSSFYETQGIQIDQTKSHSGNVFIQKADANTEGTFKCEILAEAPHFETVRKQKELKVYVPPNRGPKVDILDSNGRVRSPKAEISYLPGDRIELRCSSGPSRPAARLRWFVNDQELIIPVTTALGSNPLQPSANSSQASNLSLKHPFEVRLSPVEYRASNSMKAVYSSHSNLSLLLRREDLRNNTITFKCLASIRVELTISHKQLIVALEPGEQHQESGRNGGKQQNHGPRFTRSDHNQNDRWVPTAGPPFLNPNKQLLQLQHHHHLDLLGTHARDSSPRTQFGVLMQPQAKPQAQSQSQQANPISSAFFSGKHRLMSVGSGVTLKQTPLSRTSTSTYNNNNNNPSEQTLPPSPSVMDGGSNDAVESNQDEQINPPRKKTDPTKALYIYEQVDSSLGPSIVENYSTLENYLSPMFANYSPESISNNRYSEDSKQAQYLRWDNAEHMQLLRREQARARQHPLSGWQQNNNPTMNGQAQKRFISLTGLVKSPLYFDEFDPLRPVINWPPFESGSLMLQRLDNGEFESQLEQGSKLIAIPTMSEDQHARHYQGRNNLTVYLAPSNFQLSHYSGRSHSIFEQLLQNLNCTSWDSSIESRLAWTINDVGLTGAETRYFATKLSSDHRQIGSTIGFKLAQVISKEAKFKIAPDQLNSGQPVKIGCQATHSVLLFSSSELITFDFNPSSPNSASSTDQSNGNINKQKVLQTNSVIQAISASQSGNSAQSNKPSGLEATMPLVVFAITLALTSVTGMQWSGQSR